MKNIHIIPTEKPSRLHCYDWSSYGLSKEHLQWKQGRNIYITSDEEIKEGDYSLYLPFGVGKNIVIDGELCFHIEAKDGKGSFTQRTYQTLDRNKKIILTTDQDLIKDGVQAIDDEFLEWFVKNPICEEVAVILHEVSYVVEDNIYKIIIPKEEPKQDYSKIREGLKKSIKGKEHFIQHFKNGGTVEDFKPSEEAKQRAANYMSLKGALEPKQDTLEEAAERFYQKGLKDDLGLSFHDGVSIGAKWQQERMYSDEDVKSVIEKTVEQCNKMMQESYGLLEIDVDYIFEQFKKK